jgi:hypothetical protein
MSDELCSNADRFHSTSYLHLNFRQSLLCVRFHGSIINAIETKTNSSLHENVAERLVYVTAAQMHCTDFWFPVVTTCTNASLVIEDTSSSHNDLTRMNALLKYNRRVTLINEDSLSQQKIDTAL